MIDRDRLPALMAAERDRFDQTHPASAELAFRGRRSLLAGVPMHWMVRWAGGFPVFVDRAEGAHFTDVDGHEYVDLCLGDTGAMTGHSPPGSTPAIAAQLERGITTMLPTRDAIEVAEELGRRFGVTNWQFTLTATDANRFVIRLARQLTGRPRILVFNGCYHGTVDETIVRLDADGSVVARPGSIGPPVDPSVTTRVCEFNDLDALERELEHGDVALVLAEPAMTNVGIVMPIDGYHAALRDLTRAHDVLLALDETHTICCGPEGATGAWGLEPDILTVGKPIGSGVPSGAYGLSAELDERITDDTFRDLDVADVGGIGGTLAGNALSLAAMDATLRHVLTAEAFAHTIPLAARFAEGVDAVIAEHGLGWHVAQLGCRAEYRFQPDHPRNGGEAIASDDPELDAYLHLYALNRGVLMTPFHNMALMSPATTEADVDRHTAVFTLAVESLLV
ncbi:MAG TPA: aspartate aminotransferase family protein [Microthrixaceae bacterium]|nr:aspartate aminotransferase family protein [Microthrixaceae bacterium]